MDTVEKTMALVRFKRLKNPERRAALLAAALADLDRAPAYAIQKWEENSRAGAAGETARLN